MRGIAKKVGISASIGSALLLSGCSNQEFTGFGFTSDATSVNEQAHGLWQGAWLAAAVVGVFTMVLILWPAFFHRKKDETFPKQTQYNIPTEIA